MANEARRIDDRMLQGSGRKNASEANRIPQEFIEKLLERVDIVDIVDGSIKLQRAGDEYRALCPFHDEKTPSFTVVPHKGFYHCFGCQAHGNAITFVMQYQRLGFPQAVALLAERAGLTVPGCHIQRTGSAIDYTELLAQAERYYRRQLVTNPDRTRAISSLRKRGITMKMAERFDFGFAPASRNDLVNSPRRTIPVDHLVSAGLAAYTRGTGKVYDRFRDRLMFPIRNLHGKTIGFGGRALQNDRDPKYLNSPESALFKKRRILYGLHEMKTATWPPKRLLVVEGYLDVVGLAQHGIDNAVATLGTAISQNQIDGLFKYTEHVVFCFDGDRAGREATWRAVTIALRSLGSGRMISIVMLPKGEDPDSLIRKEGMCAFERRIESAIPASDYLFDTLAARYDPSSLEGRAGLIERARPLLDALPSGIYKSLMIHRLNSIVELDLIDSRGKLKAIPPVRCA